MPRQNETRVANWLISALALGTLATCVPRLAHAHFHLDAPPSWANQNSTGDPQKSGPCGETNMAGTTQAVPTNVVTPFQPGQTISVTITETVMHPGHYRVALAPDRSMLPADPAVTADSKSACGSAVIDSTPEYPVLVDGALVHTAKFSGPQTIQVKLPSDVTCTKCTLQVIEFMSNHGLNNPGGCFYHHCADISIQAGGASSGGTGGGGASGGGGTKGGAGGTNGGTTTGGSANAGGGAGGAGGTTQGGASASGGAPQGGTNTGGTSTGGTFGSGGQSASGGAPQGGTNTGGTTSTGGVVATTGGSNGTGGTAASGGSTSTGGTGAGSPNAGTAGADPPDDSGCGFSVGGYGHKSLAGIAGLAALGGLLLRRRRR
jgi:MYXO-CTERM domain-containing protein